MNEWAFAGEIKTWWDDEFSRHPEWHMNRCELENAGESDRQRSDLAVLGQGLRQICGELRLPDHAVASPWHPDNLSDAIDKARSRGAKWAFTSDGTRLLLIDTRLTGPPARRVVQDVALVPFQTRAELDSEAFLNRVKQSWQRAIVEIAPVIAGIQVAKGMAIDESFINSLHALLASPVSAIREELNGQRLADPAFAQRLVKWMVDEQGWGHVPERWEAETLRAARLTSYVFTTRLMFYEALRRSHPALAQMYPLSESAVVTRAMFRGFFDDAKAKSGDYETIFAWDAVCEFALLPENAADAWVRVVEHLSVFEINRVGYDILGKMFERLIDPDERYRWGQHYTSPDVVDLMLSFAIPDGEGRVLDPAVGGGTFLVRAYTRKHLLAPDKSHQELLRELYGIDVSTFAASIATINLAIRQLDFGDNYPQVAVKSFFQVHPAGNLLALPSPRRLSLEGPATIPVRMENARAVVCNPPYIRLHELGDERQNEAKQTLIGGVRRVPVPSRLHGLSNYHLYFWFHGAQFLEEGGRLVLITAGEWLDSDYGAILQKWLLENFVLECFIESLAEPWFSEARVGTVVAVARQSADPAERESSLVRFVLLRRRLRELFGRAESEGEHLQDVDALRDRLMAVEGPYGESDDFDWSTVRQSELLSLGMNLSTGSAP